jgi:5'-nucleotidase
MNNSRKQILLTNDDGIQSPGLWAAAETLSKLGYVTIAAPRDQASGTGRSMPPGSDGKITATRLQIGSQEWTAYAVGGTPAQTVVHAILELMPQPPDLVVSGINYGENIGHSITISGTVGAAMEGAACGVPSLAVSLQLVDISQYTGYSREVDFSASAHFTHLFAQLMLEKRMPPDVDLLKLDIPYSATPQTPWKVTRLARHRYFVPSVKRDGSLEDNGSIHGSVTLRPGDVPQDTDAHAVLFDSMVSITPLSLDYTSRIETTDLESCLRGGLKDCAKALPDG